MFIGKTTKKRWVAGIIWAIVIAFALSIFVLAAQFNTIRARKKSIEKKGNNIKKDIDFGNRFSEVELSKVLVKVNNDKIEFRDFYREYRSLNNESRSYFQLNTLEGKFNYLKNMVDRKIILQKAKELKINITDKEILDYIEKSLVSMGYIMDKKKIEQLLKERNQDFLRWFNEQKIPLLKDKIIDKLMLDIDISDDDIENYYKEHKKDFMVDQGGKKVLLGLEKVMERVRKILMESKLIERSKRFYENHPDMFKKPNRIKLAQIFIKKDSFSRKEIIEENLNENEIKSYYQLHKRSFLSPRMQKVSHIFLKYSDFGKDVKVKDKEIKEYYNKNKGLYSYPEKIRAQHIWLSFDSERYKTKIRISDKDIKDYYDKNRDRFTKPERVHAQHILVNTLDKANKIYKELKNGADFGELAKKYSKDTATSNNGGDLGIFSRGEMVKPFEDACFNAKINEILKPVKTPYGYHIIRVIERIEKNVQSLKEVKNDIKKILYRKKLKGYLKDLIKEIREKTLSGEDFSVLAKKYSDADSAQKNGNIGFFYKGRQPNDFNDDIIKKDGILEGHTLISEIEREVFPLKVGDISPVISTYNGYHLFKVLEKVGPQPKPFSLVRDEIKDKLLIEYSKKLAGEKADEIISKLKDGDQFSVLAKRYSKAKSAGNGGDIGYIPEGDFSEYFDSSKIDKYWLYGNSILPEIERAIFSMKMGEIRKVELNEGLEIIKITGYKLPEVLPFDKVKDKVKDMLINEKAIKKAKKLAFDVYKQIVDGKIDFESLSKKYSDGKTASDGGVLGYIDENGDVIQKYAKNFEGEGGKLGYVFNNGRITFGLTLYPEFKVNAILLNASEYTGVIETDDGFHIIKCLKRELGEPIPYAEIESDITEFLNKYVSVDEMKQYYEEHKEEYKQPEKVKLQHILVSDKKTADRVYLLLKKGESFTKLAQKFSIDSSKKTGGELGYITRGRLPKELDEVAFKLDVGNISKPIKTSYGFHIIRVEEKIPAKILPFKVKKDQIREEILKPRRNKAFYYWMIGARNKSKIKWDRDNIITLFNKI